MPFRTPPGAPRDLLSLIEAELRQRLEEAVDHACLDAMVSARRASGAPLPASDDTRDREEFGATVRAFLVRLRDEIPADTSVSERVTPEPGVHADEEWRLLTQQVVRAKSLPDYWQRFETVRERFAASYVESGSSRRGVRGRLFGRG